MLKNTVEILCEANKAVGYGHLNRSMNLYKYLNSIGIKTTIRGLDNKTTKLLPKVNTTNKLSKLLIVDVKNNTKEILQKARKKNQLTVTFDYFGNYPPDYNIIIFPHKKAYSRIKSFIGLEYTIIKKEFLKSKNRIKKKKLTNIVIVIGGGDKKNISYKLGSLLNKKKLNVTIIYGPLIRKTPKDKNLKIYHNPSNYVDLLKKSDLIISNGGGCMLEAIILNKPVIAIPQSIEEKNLVNFLYKKKHIYNKGITEVKKLSKNTYIAPNKNKLIDGKGLERISKIITKIINK